MKTFKHSGDLGDIIYSLSVMKSLGGGILYLDINGGIDDFYCKSQLGNGKTKFNKLGYNFLYSLLKTQKYIKEIKIYSNEEVDFNLNKFRNFYLTPSKGPNCLMTANHESFMLPKYDINIPWIECGDPLILDKRIAVMRSPRYQGAYTVLASNIKTICSNGIFLGSKKEHELFEWTFDSKIEFYNSNSALDIAKIILGSDYIIANSTFGLALAVGLPNKIIVQETEKYNNLTNFYEKKDMKLI